MGDPGQGFTTHDAIIWVQTHDCKVITTTRQGGPSHIVVMVPRGGGGPPGFSGWAEVGEGASLFEAVFQAAFKHP